MKMKKSQKKPILLIDNPLDLLSHIIIPGIALLALFNLMINYRESSEFPTVSSDSQLLIIKGVSALGGIFILKLFFQTKKADRRLIANMFEPEQINQSIYATGTYFMIQIAVMVLQNMRMFQVAAVDVFAFFISAAIIEELLYRGFVVMAVQYLVARFIHAKNERDMLLPNIAAILISGSIFALVHNRYWADPALMLLTFLGGCSQAYWYIKSKSLLVPMMAHAAINLTASGSLLQTLNS